MQANNIFKLEESMNAVLYILEKCGGCVDAHKVFKILYFADREHLSEYGSLITNDTYVKMEYGPVPSKIYDIVKFVASPTHSGLSSAYFSVDGFMMSQKVPCDERFLSVSNRVCLDKAIALCKDMSFGELTRYSHQDAWRRAKLNEPISYRDMALECGNTEEYASFVEEQIVAANILAS